jgi:hypothetical protein
MNRKLSIMLVYEPIGVGGRPIPIARTEDGVLTLAAAKCVLAEAEARVVELQCLGSDFVAIERKEADRLRHVLTKLLPSLNESPRAAPVM